MGIYACFTCGKEINRTASQVEGIDHVFCSRVCYVEYRKKMGATLARKSEYISKRCPVCDVEFSVVPSRADALYCSLTCKGIASRLKPIICKTCGDEFTPKHLHNNPKYCSRKCSGEGRKTGTNRLCNVCGQEFYAKSDSTLCCSLDCANQWQGRNKVELICGVCQKTYKVSPSSRNRKYCSIECRDKSEEAKAHLINMNVMQQQKLTPNRLEQAGYKVLSDLEIEYQSQVLIANKFCVDALVPAYNLIIQFDGDYWHGNPVRFPEPDKRQMRRIALDQSQDKYLTKCGYRVLRIWESDMYNRIEWVIDQIKMSML